MSALKSIPACNHCGSVQGRTLFVKFGFDLVECGTCGLAYLSNPPEPDDLAASYQQDTGYHNALTDPNSAQFATMSRVATTHLDFVRHHAQGGRLLDVGCSTGLFLDKARASGFDVSGVEFSKGSADFARGHFGLTVADGDIHAVDAADASFDIVTMFDVIEHVPDPSRDMAKAYAMLKPRGLFIVSTPNIDGLFPQASLKIAKLIDYWPHPEPPHHLYQFSTRTLTAMLEKSGFSVVGERQINIDLAYSFGNISALARSPKLLAYAMLFAPAAKLGPLIGRGDWFYLAARKR